MITKLKFDGSIKTDIFGGFCPYWTLYEGDVYLAENFCEIIEAIPVSDRIIEPMAVLELMQFNYMLGNRTLVQGIRRMPWRAELFGNGNIIRSAPVPHGHRVLDPVKTAKKLLELLEEEILEVIGDHSKVYLLLSGGLDSRIVAGILKKNEHIFHSKIICVTWGDERSRDVVYARRIASWFDWEIVQVPYDWQIGWSNIKRGAIWGGSEVSGIHLHGLYWFEQVNPGDLIIAASFGDSIGRAEYSGRSIREISLKEITNVEDLIHPTLVKSAIISAEEDRSTAWQNSGLRECWSKAELDMQENYMRRMICHAMDYVRQFCNLHQAFTSEKIVSFIWSLSEDCRKDSIYFELFKMLDSRLLSLPWARNGTAYDGTKELNPHLSKDYHNWSSWLKHELKPYLEERVFSSNLEELGIFNFTAINRLWKYYYSNENENFGIGETLVKLCSIAISAKHDRIQQYRKPTKNLDYFLDYFLRLKRFGKRILT